jgi:hypothetical protein
MCLLRLHGQIVYGVHFGTAQVYRVRAPLLAPATVHDDYPAAAAELSTPPYDQRDPMYLLSVIDSSARREREITSAYERGQKRGMSSLIAPLPCRVNFGTQISTARALYL